MRKKENVIIYPNLYNFSSFCDEYAKSLKIGKSIKNFILLSIIIIFTIIFVGIVFFFLKVNWIYSLVINVFLIAAAICNYFSFLRIFKKKEIFLDLYDCFIKLISDKRYNNFDSLASLKEISFYLKDIKNQKNIDTIFSLERLKKWPLITPIISIFVNNNFFSFLRTIFKDKSSLVLVILLIILLFFYGVKEILSFAVGNNYRRLCDSLLLSCITERRNEIINSSQNSLVSKFQYAFKLGKYH